MEKKHINVLKLFLNGFYVTAAAVSECLDVGMKTARLRIKELDQVGKDNGFRIDSRPHYGYYIKIEDEGKLRHYIDEVAFRNKIPSSVDERTYYLLAFFINHRQYIKQEELCDFLFVSRTTLQYSMKSIETILSAYGISFDRKPNFGLRLQGREVDLRRCIGDYFIRQNFFEYLDGNRQTEELQVLGNKVMELVGLCHIHMSETAFESFIHHIYIAIKRIRKGCMIEDMGNPDLFLMVKEREFINWLVKDLEDFYHITISEPEKVYLSLYFAGKRTVQIDEGDNFFITEDIRIIVKEILEMIYEEYNVDLRSDFHVQMMMGSHAFEEQSTLYSVIQAGIYGAQQGEAIGRKRSRIVGGASVTERMNLAISIAMTSHSKEDRLRQIYDVVGTGLHISEAVPAAFGILLVCNGEAWDSVCEAVNIGYDTDTVAAIVGSVAGALEGSGKADQELVMTLNRENEIQLEETAERVTELIMKNQPYHIKEKTVI